MKKTLRIILRDIRAFLAGLSGRERAVFLFVWILIVLRVVFPVKHMANGYVVYLDPILESEICLLESSGCGVDISRTFAAAGTLGLTALGLGYLVRQRKLAHQKRKG